MPNSAPAYRYDSATELHHYAWDGQQSWVTDLTFRKDFWLIIERVAKLHLANLVVC